MVAGAAAPLQPAVGAIIDLCGASSDNYRAVQGVHVSHPKGVGGRGLMGEPCDVRAQRLRLGM